MFIDGFDLHKEKGLLRCYQTQPVSYAQQSQGLRIASLFGKDRSVINQMVHVDNPMHLILHSSQQ